MSRTTMRQAIEDRIDGGRRGDDVLRIPSLRGFVILLEGKNDACGGVVSRVTIRNLAVTIRKVPNV